jgi:hypothetical protein
MPRVLLLLTAAVVAADGAAQSPRYLAPRTPGGSVTTAQNAADAAAEVELLWPSRFVEPVGSVDVPPNLLSVEEYVEFMITWLELPAVCERCCESDSDCAGWPGGAHECRAAPGVTARPTICLPRSVQIEHTACDRHATWIACPKGITVAALWGTGSAVCAVTYFSRKWADTSSRRVLPGPSKMIGF